MKRRRLQVLSLSVAIMLTGQFGLGPSSVGVSAAHSVSAAPLSITGTWSSGFQVMNIDSVEAQVMVRYVSSSGGADVPQGPVTIPVGQSYTFFGPTMSAPAGFRGSVVVESTAKVAAISNLFSTNPNMWASYNGVTTPGTLLYLPLIMRKNGGWSTSIYVQNAGSATANVKLSFRRVSAAPRDVALSVAVGVMGSIDQGSETDPNMVALGDRWVGSVVITSDQPVAAMVIESNGTELMAYSGFSSGASRIYAPLLQNNNSGWISSVQVQNIGNGAVGPVKLWVNGSVVWEVAQLQPGEMAFKFPVTFNARYAGGYVEGPVGSQLVGIVNQLGPNGQATSYSMFTSGTARVAAPLLMLNNNGWYTGFQVQNVGSTATSIRLKVNGTEVAGPFALQPAEMKAFFPLPGVTGPFVGAGEIVSDPGSQLVGMVNEICAVSRCAAGDNSMTYEALNVQ